MADIFADLEKLGIKATSDKDTVEREEIDLSSFTSSKKKNVACEKDYIFEKTYECPICGQPFREKTVKIAKKRIVGHEEDLKPVYEGIEVGKYDVILCPHCGYATLMDSFGLVNPTISKLIKAGVSAKFKMKKDSYGDIYTYDDAIDRFKLALVNCIVRRGHFGDRAYLCLRLSWLYRAKVSEVPECSNDYEVLVKKYKNLEMEFVKKAYECFTESLAKEMFPIAGMDEVTLSYVMGVLARKCGDYDNSMKLLGRVIFSRGAKENIKELARTQKKILDGCIAEANA